MSSLKIRKIRWQFDPDIPFQWNPANPHFGLAMNTMTFIAPAFERYVLDVMREAGPLIEDPGVRSEARAFGQQEGLHAAAHRAHANVLIEQYPGLVEVTEALQRHFDELRRSEPLKFHLAYIADIEASFAPMFNTFLRNTPTLFDNGDPRVAPLFLWHFVEEIEHRCSALMVYDELVASPTYRTRMLPRVLSHVMQGARVCMDGFSRHVPKQARMVDVQDSPSLSPRGILQRFRPPKGDDDAPAQLYGVPRREKIGLVLGLIRSQLPTYVPQKEQTPPFADEWLARYDEGRDVAHWYADELTEAR